MLEFSPADFGQLYAQFDSPITILDCGTKCAPYNEYGAPFCCDTRHAVSSAYHSEWAYLQANTDLWHPWKDVSIKELNRLKNQTPVGQVLIECLGHTRCQRQYRSITCRAFPFFPYLTQDGVFIGLSYYWEYEQLCWVISNLSKVTAQYRAEFITAYDLLFEIHPGERENFHYHSSLMRLIFRRFRRSIPLLHRNGHSYKITPHNGRMRRALIEDMPRFGTYKIAADLPFPDELES